MHIARYVDTLRSEFLTAAESAGADLEDLANRDSLDAVARLVLLEVLSDAAAEITTELAPGSVELRLRGRDPEFVVMAAMPPRPEVQRTVEEPVDHEGAAVRTTIRLPEHVKERVDDAARQAGTSVNSWLIRAVTAALDTQASPPVDRFGPSAGQRYRGWIR